MIYPCPDFLWILRAPDAKDNEATSTLATTIATRNKGRIGKLKQCLIFNAPSLIQRTPAHNSSRKQNIATKFQTKKTTRKKSPPDYKRRTTDWSSPPLIFSQSCFPSAGRSRKITTPRMHYTHNHPQPKRTKTENPSINWSNARSPALARMERAPSVHPGIFGRNLVLEHGARERGRQMAHHDLGARLLLLHGSLQAATARVPGPLLLPLLLCHPHHVATSSMRVCQTLKRETQSLPFSTPGLNFRDSLTQLNETMLLRRPRSSSSSKSARAGSVKAVAMGPSCLRELCCLPAMLGALVLTLPPTSPTRLTHFGYHPFSRGSIRTAN